MRSTFYEPILLAWGRLISVVIFALVDFSFISAHSGNKPASVTTYTSDFESFAGVNQEIWYERAYDSCEGQFFGTFSLPVPPKYGAVTFPKRPRYDWAECYNGGDNPPPQSETLNVYYRWTGSGSLTDNFTVHFIDYTKSTQYDIKFTAHLVPSTTSWYAVNNNGLRALNGFMNKAGRRAAQEIAGGDAGTLGGVVIFDFCRAMTAQSGTKFGASGCANQGGKFLTTYDIKKAIVDFAKAYAIASGGNSVVLVVVGASNNLMDKLGAYAPKHAAAWLQMIRDLQSATKIYPGVYVIGGLDAELDWSTPDVANSWVSSYNAGFTGTEYLVDFGDAAGCPQYWSSDHKCEPGHYVWTQDQVLQVAWNGAGLVPLPEIYNTPVTRAWEQIRLYDFLQHQDFLQFGGVLTHLGECEQMGCDDPTYTQGEGWYHFSDLMHLDELSYYVGGDEPTAEPLRSTDIRFRENIDAMGAVKALPKQGACVSAIAAVLRAIRNGPQTELVRQKLRGLPTLERREAECRARQKAWLKLSPEEQASDIEHRDYLLRELLRRPTSH